MRKRIAYTNQPDNEEFEYATLNENRPLVGGGYISWENGRIVAASPNNLTLVEAVEFYRLVQDSLPQGWAGPPCVEEVEERRLSIRGDAD